MNIARLLLIGRYICADSVIHRIDGRVKILFLLVISISLFLLNSVTSFVYLFAVLFLAMIASKIRIFSILKGIVPILWLIGFTFILHSFIPPKNIEYAIEISLRLLLLFFWATLITATTTNTELAKAIAWYIRPLKIFKVSPENVALTFSLALRFFPMVLEEADNVIKAQRLRKERLSFKQKIESFCTTFMTGVLKKAHNFELSCSNRNVQEENLENLTTFRNLKLIDITVIIICFGYIVFLFYSKKCI